jgi:hypothetical protein
MADNFQTGGEHPPKTQPVDGQITSYGLDIAVKGTNTGSPLDDQNISNDKG